MLQTVKGGQHWETIPDARRSSVCPFKSVGAIHSSTSTTPQTFRFRSGGATPSKTTELRLRFVDSIVMAADDWDLADVDNPAFACSVSGYVLVCILG